MPPSASAELCCPLRESSFVKIPFLGFLDRSHSSPQWLQQLLGHVLFFGFC